MPIPSTPIEVRFNAADQRKGEKLLAPGGVTLARNVHQIEDGVIEKRDGYSSLDRTTDTGTITTASELGLAGSELALVSQDSVYVRDESEGEWKNLGGHRPAFGTYEAKIESAGFRPTRIVDGDGRKWYFSATSRNSGNDAMTDRHAVWRVEDADGREVAPLLNFTNYAVHGGKPVLVGTKIYYFFTSGAAGGVHGLADEVTVAEFNTATPTASPAISQFMVPSAGYITGMDVRSVAGTVYVVMWGSNMNGSNAAIGVCKLDTGTGGPTAAPVYTNFADNLPASRAGCLLANGSAVRGAVSHLGASPGTDKIELFTINTTTLAATFSTIDTNLELTGAAQLGGRVGPDSKLWIYRGGDTAEATAPRDGSITRYVLDANTLAVEDESQLTEGAWLVGDPVEISGTVYVIAGHESVFSTVIEPILAPQRCYSLLDGETGKVYARAMYEIGGGDHDGLAGGYTAVGFIAPVEVSGTQIIAAVGACRDGLTDYYTAELTFETAPSLGPPVQVEDALYLPGGYPSMVTRFGMLDVAPQFYPEEITTSAVATSAAGYEGSFVLCATYVMILPDGREVESQPSAFKSQAIAIGGQIVRAVVPNLRQVFGDASGIKVFIRLYSTTDLGTALYQQVQVPNRADLMNTTIDLPGIGVGKTLYTEGGVVENAACPPWKVGTYWRNRVFVSGLAERGLVYPTKPHRSNRLPEFFDDGKFSVGPVTVRALCPVDETYLAIFTDSGIAYVSGPGPTEIGSEPYLPQFIQTKQTTTNPRSVVTTPLGCMFQGLDGGIYLLGRNLEVSFIGRGADAYRASTVTSAVHMPKQQHVRFTLSTGEVLVFDYGRKPLAPQVQDDVLGQWYEWKKAAAFTPVASLNVSGVHYIMDSDGTVWNQVENQAFDGVSGFIGQKLSFPLTFAGVSGFVRCLRALFLGTWLGPHRVQLTVATDSTSTTNGPREMTDNNHRWDVRPSPSKAAHVVLTIEELQYLTSLNKGFKLDGLGFEVQRQPGMARATTRVPS